MDAGQAAGDERAQEGEPAGAVLRLGHGTADEQQQVLQSATELYDFVVQCVEPIPEFGVLVGAALHVVQLPQQGGDRDQRVFGGSGAEAVEALAFPVDGVGRIEGLQGEPGHGISGARWVWADRGRSRPLRV
ncbi:hypothetical protein [Streptomyces iakyrus]|uniref:hypothetical protein n=1 Tax=Streptomyces iakyrus TaxID=68219 RepID=UPI003839F0A5